MAKLTNHCAKKSLAGQDGVCDFGSLSDMQLSELFNRIPVGEIWGIGSRPAQRLADMNIQTVEALRQSDAEYIRQQFSVVVERTVKELNGTPCIELEEAGTPRQQIMVSRSVGQSVMNLDDLSESIAYFATTAAEKLRHDQFSASSLCIFIRTNPFNERDDQYSKSIIVTLRLATDDTTKLVAAALLGLRRIYRNGHRYKKSGVLLMGLHPNDQTQGDLFQDTQALERSKNLMKVMDAINRRMWKGSLTVAAAGIQQRWAMRREMKSAAYTSSWDELIITK